MTAARCGTNDCSCAGAVADPTEIHIAGILVHARPDRAGDICIQLASIPHAEVTHQAPDGRLVVVLEAASGRALVEQMDGIRKLDGVLGAALVYQHAEPADEMDKEMEKEMQA